MLRQDRSVSMSVPSGRPAVSSNQQHWPDLRAMECLNCGNWTEIPIEVRNNPEKFVEWREELEALHSTCGKRTRVN